MTISAHICEKCRQPNAHPNETYRVYDANNVHVGNLHRFIAEDMDGKFYAKAIAADKSWVDFEAEQLKKIVPALYPIAYTHPGRNVITSDPLPSLADAKRVVEVQFAVVKAWLEQRTGPIEIVH